MSQETSLLLAAIIAGFAILVFLINKKLSELAEKQKPSDELLKVIDMLQTTSKEERRTLLETLQKNTQSINERLDRAAKVIGGLQKEAGQFSEISRSMKELQEFLQSPKLRGNIGEEVLRDLLSQVFPKDTYSFQYQFKTGDKVDAILRTDAGILPIDSKFPMENFQRMLKEETKVERQRAKREFARDVRKHIDDISKKYILPEEGTVDFAIMYVPSEAVYYEIVNLSAVIKHARAQRVYPVSPTTLYAHLRIILMSFEGKRIEQQARQVLSSIRAIQKDYEKVGGTMSVLGRHINNAYNTMSSLVSSFTQLGQKITSTQAIGKETAEEVKQVEVGDGQA